MTPFTQSPIEAALWTSFVGMQQWVVDNILLTPLFKAAVATWLGILFIRAMFAVAAGRDRTSVMGRFVLTLILSAVGLSILHAKNSEPFRPSNAAGRPWSGSARVRTSGKYDSLSSSSAQGLAFYVQIHRGANAIAALVSGKVAELFKSGRHNESPYLMLQTLAQTAGQTIDDPAAMSSLNWLFENCADKRSAPVLASTSSYSALFDLSRPDCAERHGKLRQELTAWSRDKWGTSWWNVGQIGVAELQTKFGFMDEETLRNKMIASALVNTARQQMGRNRHNVNTGALLGAPGQEPTLGPATSYFTALGNTLSMGGATNAFLSPFTGNDYWGADARNQSAFLYNRIVQFLPPIRGYAKGILAITFVFAAASLCFGTPRFMMSWLGMLLVFTAYEPLSTMLYESAMLFTNAKETTDALSAIRNDPLVLSGAAIVDDNLARIQGVYFALQLGLAGVCAAGGISIFVFTKRLGTGLSETIVSKVATIIHMSPKGVSS